MKWDLREGDQSVDVDEADDAAFRRELGTVVQCFDKIKYLLHRGRFSKQIDPLLIKCIWLLFNVLFLTEEEKVAVFRNLFSLSYILTHLRMEDRCNRVNDRVNTGHANGRADVERAHRG